MLAPEIAPPAQRHQLAVGLGSLVLVVLLPLLFVIPRLQDHPRQTLTLTNPTEILVTVDLRGSPAAASTPLGRVPADGRVTVEEIWDEGDLWILRFRGQGQPLGEVTLRRADLEASQWTVEVPDAVITQMRDLDLSLTQLMIAQREDGAHA